jgi:demethylmenaquinone methyltransferase/2-methoxy-6-polyprenyl-1,4-benzoquinol methylase
VAGGCDARGGSDRALQLADGLFGLLDPRRALGQAHRDEARAELVEVAAARGLLGHLAERGDRSGVPNQPSAEHRLTVFVQDNPVPAVPRGFERTEIDARTFARLGDEHTGQLFPCLAKGLGGLRDPLELVAQGHTLSIDSAPMAEAVTPRTREARALFAPLGPTYDRYARLLSLGQDPRWRRFLVDRVEVRPDEVVLDVATGTGAVAIELVRRWGCSVVGIDQSPEMLAEARGRIALAAGTRQIRLVEGRAEALPFEDGRFDGLTVTYLLRYVDDPGATLNELARVVHPGGTMASLEFGIPEAPIARAGWELYTGVGLRLAGRVIGPGWSEVGSFLRGSIRSFYARLPLDRQLALWREAGVADVRVRRLSLGGGVVVWGRRT